MHAFSGDQVAVRVSPVDNATALSNSADVLLTPDHSKRCYPGLSDCVYTTSQDLVAAFKQSLQRPPSPTTAPPDFPLYACMVKIAARISLLEAYYFPPQVASSSTAANPAGETKFNLNDPVIQRRIQIEKSLYEVQKAMCERMIALPNGSRDTELDLRIMDLGSRLAILRQVTENMQTVVRGQPSASRI